MNCTGNCNQGRQCSCAPALPPHAVIRLAMILAIVMVVVMFALLEALITGVSVWTERIAVAGIVAAAAAYVLRWVAGKVIRSIDWITRHE